MDLKPASQKLPLVKLHIDLIGLQDGCVEQCDVVFGKGNPGQADFAESVEPAGLNIDGSAAKLPEFRFGSRRYNEKADPVKDRRHKKQPDQHNLNIQQKPMPSQKPPQKSDFQASYHDGP